MKVKTIQLLEENVGEFFCDLEVGNDLWNKTSKVKLIRKKDDFDYIWAMLSQRLE